MHSLFFVNFLLYVQHLNKDHAFLIYNLVLKTLQMTLILLLLSIQILNQFQDYLFENYIKNVFLTTIKLKVLTHYINSIM